MKNVLLALKTAYEVYSSVRSVKKEKNNQEFVKDCEELCKMINSQLEEIIKSNN